MAKQPPLLDRGEGADNHRDNVQRAGLLLLLSAIGFLASASACGNGGGAPPSGTPEPTSQGAATPAIVPTIQLTPQQPLGPAATPTASIDLAEAQPLLSLVTPDSLDIQTGISSLATGDFNGDGVDDLLIGLPFADGPDNTREDAGEALVIFGDPRIGGEMELSGGEVGLHVLGALPGDTLGFGVASGDLNGDGIDDVIVGAPGSNGLANIRTDLGEAYVIFGRADLGGTVDTAEEQQDFTLIAAEGFARLGSSFAVADVNGDGIDDLIAGAPFAGREPGTPPGGPRTTVGEVYVVFGSPDLRGRKSVAEDQQDLTLSGGREMDSFGQSVAAADINGDELADIIVGAGGYDGPAEDRRAAGAVFVFLSSPAPPGKRGLDDADLTILGADPDDALGERVASGDFNGDGLADILMVARNADGPDGQRGESGEVYVLFGSDSLSGTLDLAADGPDAVVYGVDLVSLMGTAVATGDLDGDGLDDVVLGAPLASPQGRPQSGAVYVLYGKDLSAQTDLRREPGDALFVYGPSAGDGLGTSATLGDLNSDGRLELVLAAAGDLGEAQRQGVIYVLSLP